MSKEVKMINRKQFAMQARGSAAALAVALVLFALACAQGPPEIPNVIRNKMPNPTNDHGIAPPTQVSVTENSGHTSDDGITPSDLKLGIRLYVSEDDKEMVETALAEMGIIPTQEGINNFVVYITGTQIDRIIGMPGVFELRMAEEQPYLDDFNQQFLGGPYLKGDTQERGAE